MRYWPLILCFLAAACSGSSSPGHGILGDEVCLHTWAKQTPGDRMEGNSSAAPAVSTEMSPAEVNSEESKTAEGSAIHLSPAEHDFGAVKAGEKLALTLEITGPAGQALRLGRVMSSCPCVTVSAPKRIFGPEETAEVLVMVVPRSKPGEQRYVVTTEILDEPRTLVQSELSFRTGMPDGKEAVCAISDPISSFP